MKNPRNYFHLITISGPTPLVRLGVSEVDLVREVIIGVNALIDLEKRLEAGDADLSSATASIGVERKPIETDAGLLNLRFSPVITKPQASNFPDFSKHNNWTSK